MALSEQDLRDALQWCAQHVFEGFDIDGGGFQDEMEARGILVKVPAEDAFRDEWDADEMYVLAWSLEAAGELDEILRLSEPGSLEEIPLDIHRHVIELPVEVQQLPSRLLHRASARGVKVSEIRRVAGALWEAFDDLVEEIPVVRTGRQVWEALQNVWGALREDGGT